VFRFGTKVVLSAHSFEHALDVTLEADCVPEVGHVPIAACFVRLFQLGPRHTNLHSILDDFLQSMNSTVDLLLKPRSIKRLAYHPSLLSNIYASLAHSMVRQGT
jgi:hypothetical protein